jgi:hypothetical protein
VRDVERREENVTMKDLEALVKSVRERIQAEADGRYLVISRVTDSVTGQDVFEECVHDTDDVQEATSVAGALNPNAYEEAKPYRARG